MAQIQTLEGLGSTRSHLAQTESTELTAMRRQRNIAIGVGVVAVAGIAYLQYRWWVSKGVADCTAKCARLAGQGY